MENKEYTISDFRKVITHLGLVFTTICLILNFMPAVYASLTLGIWPSAGDLMKLWLAAAAAFGVGWAVQPISFFPIVGLAGTFIAWICGNVGDLRVPASTMAQKATDCEQGTPKAELIGFLGIAASIFTSVTIITFFAIVGASIMPMMPPFVLKALKFVLPGVLGAVYASMCTADLKLGILGLVACMFGKIVFPMIGLPGSMLMLANILFVLAVSRGYFLMFMKGKK